ncbi:hypothetical protein RRG08_043678 [Elysia crispata]|uniref:Uncharacterized protein n=1 Tax=Elysia crispata TaxID=231223 RepID=A0AAE1DNK1_9GAST|nr:hypothetical protein RRG08_043678 [Elysia crispata]
MTRQEAVAARGWLRGKVSGADRSDESGSSREAVTPAGGTVTAVYSHQGSIRRGSQAQNRLFSRKINGTPTARNYKLTPERQALRSKLELPLPSLSPDFPCLDLHQSCTIACFLAGDKLNHAILFKHVQGSYQSCTRRLDRA